MSFVKGIGLLVVVVFIGSLFYAALSGLHYNGARLIEASFGFDAVQAGHASYFSIVIIASLLSALVVMRFLGGLRTYDTICKEED